MSFHSSKGMRGFARLKLRLGAMAPFSSIITHLITPASPLVDSKCPTFVLTDARRSGW